MPLQCMQAMYWPGDGLVNNVPPPQTGWQSIAAVAAGAGLAIFLVLCLGTPYALAFVPVWPQAVIQAVWRRVPARVKVLLAVIRLVFGPEFSRATKAVREVNGMGIKTHEQWGEIGARAGRYPGIGENVFRQLRAAELYDEDHVRFGDMHVRNLALELAHFAIKEYA
jgi:hypothetical protein